MLGAIAGFWISMMLLVVVGFAVVIGTAASALVSSQSANTSVEDESVLMICFDSTIEERHSPRDFEAVINNVPDAQTLANILRAINAAKDDDRIEGIYLKCDGSAAGLATREAIARALADFKESGKWIMAYSDGYTQGDYYMASCADYLYLNPAGSVDIRGLASSIPFFKGLLDKVGVEMQIFKVGTYKSAVEPYILENMSDANREMIQHFSNSIWEGIASRIAENRSVKVETVNQWADSLVAFDSAERLVDMKVVDELKYADEVEEELKGLTNVKPGKDLRMVDYATYNASSEAPHEKKDKTKSPSTTLAATSPTTATEASQPARWSPTYSSSPRMTTSRRSSCVSTQGAVRPTPPSRFGMPSKSSSRKARPSTSRWATTPPREDITSHQAPRKSTPRHSPSPAPSAYSA